MSLAHLHDKLHKVITAAPADRGVSPEPNNDEYRDG
jgi:hypothetical protein